MKEITEDKAPAPGDDLFDGVFEKEIDTEGKPRTTSKLLCTMGLFSPNLQNGVFFMLYVLEEGWGMCR